MPALDRDQLLGFQRLFVGLQLEISEVIWSARATIIRSGVGEMREIQAPGSYILERRPERTVTSFVQAPGGVGWR
jgi:hypothetical protein